MPCCCRHRALGKPRLLREWVRCGVGQGASRSLMADERGEVAALADGVPQFAIGRCTDVLEDCSKWRAALMLLKTMSPALLASRRDHRARGCGGGFALRALRHGGDSRPRTRRELDDLRQQAALPLPCWNWAYFRRAVVIGRRGRKAGIPHGTMGGDGHAQADRCGDGVRLLRGARTVRAAGPAKAQSGGGGRDAAGARV